jgi:hypothetical protein
VCALVKNSECGVLMHCHHTGPVKEKRQGQNGRV